VSYQGGGNRWPRGHSSRTGGHVAGRRPRVKPRGCQRENERGKKVRKKGQLGRPAGFHSRAGRSQPKRSDSEERFRERAKTQLTRPALAKCTWTEKAGRSEQLTGGEKRGEKKKTKLKGTGLVSGCGCLHFRFKRMRSELYSRRKNAWMRGKKGSRRGQESTAWDARVASISSILERYPPMNHLTIYAQYQKTSG